MSGKEPRSVGVTPEDFDRFPKKRSTGAAATFLERKLLERALAATGNPPLKFVLWDGAEITSGEHPSYHRINIKDRGALWRIALYPEYQFPEMYAQGRIDSESDLSTVLEVIQSVRRDTNPANRLLQFAASLYRPMSGSLTQARQNIHHHYDVGNEFYRLWLDEQMLYTCAYFKMPEQSLEAAQVAKMDHICRKLRLRPGESVVEAGCGWGALALHMARKYGVKVRAFNISKAQLAYARERAARENLSDRVEFVEGDYREIQGEHDAFVSVGMLEHVGPKRYPALSAVIDRCLTPAGRGLIHTIGTNRPALINAWIERRIFPGAHPPSLGEMMDLFEPYGFSVLDVENIRLHYAKTIQHWLRRFEAASDQIKTMFDEEFVRTWRFYLAASETSFTTGHLQLFQVVFSRSRSNQIPWTREYLYHPTD